MFMAEKSSFFASVGGDRKYGAADWAAYFGALVGNGYFAASLTALQATASGSGLGVSINAGKAFINGYFYNNTEPLALTLDPADGVLPRIDRVVVRLSYTGRAINTVIKKGTPASSPAAPAMQRDAEAWELALADVTVPAGATAISAQNIADRRNDKAYCGPVVAMIEHIDTDEFAQQIGDALAGVQADADALLEQMREELAAARDGSLYLLRSGGTMTGDITIDTANMRLVIRDASGTEHYWRFHMDPTGGSYIATGENGYDNNLIQMSWRDTLFARPIAVEGGAAGDIARQTRENLGMAVAGTVTETGADAVSGAAVAAYVAQEIGKIADYDGEAF